MLIKNAEVFLPDGSFSLCDAACSDVIEGVGMLNGKADIDAAGCYLIPGFVDVHTHGAVGCDASDGDADGLAKMSRYYAAHGVTSFCATTMTLPEEQLTTAMETVRDFKRPQAGARCIGVNLEGPFLSDAKKGAQCGDYLHAPDTDMFLRLNTASGGRIRLCGVAPEEGGAMEFIRRVSGTCAVSLAHTAADYDTACEAYDCGATQATHLFNGMNAYAHRAPGVVGAAMDKGAYVELICDGLHIHPSVIRGVFRMFAGRVMLISDSLRCAGMPDGDYELGGQPIVVKDGRATLLNGTIAGSSISLIDAVRNVVRFGIPLSDAVRAATANPADAVRMGGSIGRIAPGAAADMLILDRQLNIRHTIIAGRVI